MISFERTQNFALVRGVMADPEVYLHITDDLSPTVERFEPCEHPAIWYVIAKERGRLLGLWAFHPQNSVCWEVHTCLLPDARSAGIEAGKQLPSWIWEHTPCQRIVTNVPADNRRARIFARAVGLAQYGVNPASFLSGGKLQDQYLFGISRPKETPCQQP